MQKDIISKETKTLVKGTKTKIKTNIEHLKTYNEKIIKENTFLETEKNSPFDLYIITYKGYNLAYITLESQETYTVKENQYLGTIKTK